MDLLCCATNSFKVIGHMVDVFLEAEFLIERHILIVTIEYDFVTADGTTYCKQMSNEPDSQPMSA